MYYILYDLGRTSPSPSSRHNGAGFTACAIRFYRLTFQKNVLYYNHADGEKGSYPPISSINLPKALVYGMSLRGGVPAWINGVKGQPHGAVMRRRVCRYRNRPGSPGVMQRKHPLRFWPRIKRANYASGSRGHAQRKPLTILNKLSIL